MVAFLVVFEHPGPGHFPDLVEIPKKPGIENLCSIGSVEAFDIRVLVWLSGLDVVDQDAMVSAPGRKRLAQELRTVVGAQHIGQAAFRCQLFEHPDQARARQRGIDFNLQRLPVEVIQDVECPEPHTLIQRIAHEVGRPHLVGT